MFLLALTGSVWAVEPDRVLLLHSFGPEFSPWSTITPLFREELRKRASRPVDLYEASLQSERSGESPAPEERPLIDYLNALVPAHDLKLMVALGAPATRFMLRNRKQLFPSSPLLIAISDVQTYADLPLTGNDTACPTTYDPTINVEDILRILPETRTIVIATGGSSSERFWANSIRHSLERFSSRVNFEWLTGMSAEDMVKRVAGLPPRSAIFYPTVRTDADGAPQEGDALLLRFIELGRAPIFTHVDSYFGKGIVGGPMFSSLEIGQKCAEMAVRLLDGEAPATIKMPPIGLATPIYDWRQLQRWGIKESLLPPNSNIFFREPSTTEKYRWQIAVVCALILLQGAMITGLLHERRRRHHAEMQSRERMSELAHTNRYATVGELTASIAHELNQPLGSILTNAETAQLMLKSSTPDLNELREILSDIHRDDQRASEVIQRLRSLLKRAPFELRRFDVNEVVRETIGLLSGQADARAVRFDSLLAITPLPIECDHIQLQQVIINLVVNAMDAMAIMPSSRRRVAIATRRTARLAEISVSDTGPGIPPEDLKHVFEPFFSTRTDGMGMGLSIARTIVEAHNGQIDVSNNAGGGATFRVRLPIA